MHIIKTVFFLLLTIFFLSCDGPEDSPYPVITFARKASLPISGRASAASFVIGGKGYLVLGRTAQRSGAMKDCWQYDPVQDKWTQKSSFPGIARVKAAAAVVNGKAYVGLGFNISLGVYNYDACLKDFWMYDPISDTWVQKADFPSNYTDACGCFVSNNEIYIFTGMNSAGFGRDVWKFEPDTGDLGTWIKMSDFSGSSRVGGIASATDQHFYFGSGYCIKSLNDWWEYFPLTDKWIQRKQMPDNGRENAVSLNINNRIFVSSGRHFAGNLTGGGVKADILEYDINKDLWYVRGNIPGGGRENAIAFTIDGKCYIGFGENDTEVLNDFWSFEP